MNTLMQRLEELKTKRKVTMRAFEDALTPDWKAELEAELMTLDNKIRTLEQYIINNEVETRGGYSTNQDCAGGPAQS